MDATASLTCVDGWTPPTSPAPVSRPALLTAFRSTSAAPGRCATYALSAATAPSSSLTFSATSASSSISVSGVPGKQSSRRGVWCHALSELAKVIVMPNGEVPSRSELEADECLHCAIIDMVDERIAAGANTVDLTALIAESLVDVSLLKLKSMFRHAADGRVLC